MKKLISTSLIISVFSLSSCSQTINMEEERQYLVEERGIMYYRGSPFIGIGEVYYKNGQLKERRTYKDGKKDGPYDMYFENGQSYQKMIFKNGEFHGPYELYYKNGQLRVKTTYKNGKKDGPYEEYKENGQLWVKSYYKDGREVYD